MCSGPHAPPYCPLQRYGEWVHCDCVEDHFRWHAVCLKYQIVLQIKYSDRNNANYKELLVSATSSSKYIMYVAAAKSLQSCPTLCDPIDSSPLGSSVPGILQARILEWVAISFSNACMHTKSLQSCPTLCDHIDSSPLGSSVPGILQAGTLEWVAISFSNCYINGLI